MWKNIENYENYEINENGCIRNRKTKRVLKPDIDKKWGYARVRLYKNDGTSKHELIHRLVASTFLDNRFYFPEVNHKDENKLNNCVDNLEWCSSKYNSRYSKGKPVIMYYPPKKFGKIFYCIREAEKETGIDNTSITRCCKGKQKHAGGFIWEYAEKKEIEL